MIELRSVARGYAGVRAIDGIDLAIERGEFVVLLGASGSGKSTLLKMINRMEGLDAGSIHFEGRDIASFDVRELRLRMGYAIQSVGLFPHWTVARNIAAVPQMLGWTPEKIAKRVDVLLEMFGLDPAVYRTRMPHQLSGGQQQRIGVARALAADPDVLLMDEPFGALDPVIRAALQHEMKRLHQRSGKTIVMVTHDVDEALRLATRIVLLDKGRVVQAATPLGLLAEPANDGVVDFVGRSDIGIKLLSLQTVRGLVRAEGAAGGDSLPGSTTLREAVSFLAAHRVSSVDVVDEAGLHVGVLHAADIFGPGPRHG
ncbi:MAG: transporter related protein [Polaromonas sp.]|nr:transporter related protein [Polaromonas sp.]